MPFDLYIFNVLHSIAGLSRVTDWLIVFLAKPLGYLLILGAAILLIRIKDIREKFNFFSLVILSAILSRAIITEVIRFVYDRPRPFALLNFIPLFNHEPGSAFPSGHAAFYFALAFAILFYFSKEYKFSRKNFGWWYVLAAALIVLGRVIAGLHWPTDVLGGAAVALVSVLGVRQLLKPLFRKTA